MNRNFGLASVLSVGLICQIPAFGAKLGKLECSFGIVPDGEIKGSTTQLSVGEFEADRTVDISVAKEIDFKNTPEGFRVAAQYLPAVPAVGVLQDAIEIRVTPGKDEPQIADYRLISKYQGVNLAKMAKGETATLKGGSSVVVPAKPNPGVASKYYWLNYSCTLSAR